MAEDESLKILFTKIRQLTCPFIAPTWVILLIFVFHRSFGQRHFKKLAVILCFIPALTALTTLGSVLGIAGAESMVAHALKEIPAGGGLWSYEVGPLLRLHFHYTSVCVVGLFFMYFVNIFSSQAHLRKYAYVFLFGSTLTIFSDLSTRYSWNSSMLVQMSVVTALPLVWTMYYAVTRLEFLNIKTFTQQRVLESLPMPVLTLTPRFEVWEANQEARKVFVLNQDYIGARVEAGSAMDFIRSRPEKVSFGGRSYQAFYHEIPVGAEDKKGLIVVLNDVSEILELNRDLDERNQILKSMNAEILKVTDFNRKIQTVLSHDMTGVLASLNMLVLNCQKNSVASAELDLQRSLQQIQQASQASINLLRNVLTWSYQGDRGEYADVSVALHRVLSQLSAQISEKNISIKERVLAQNATVLGVQDMLEAILRNLLSNALKYSFHSGTVEIEINDDGKQLCIAVADSGAGMSREVLQDILSRKVFKGERSEGFGVGLKFTIEFVEKMGGQFQIESELGRGTTARVFLPLHEIKS